MLVSYRWLGRHVDLEGIDPQDLARELTLSTAEVEDLTPFAPQLADVTVGYVVDRVRHPSADRLSLCTVDVGGEGNLEIVCGAQNVAAGQKVAVAKVGTVLPGEVKIKRAKIRGVTSQGMICSLRELALGDEHEGIWVLPEDAQVGRGLRQALDLEDWVLEIDNKSLTHRPDLWGHRGMAREVAAIFQRDLAPLEAGLPATADGAPPRLAVQSPDCPRYLGLAIDGAQNRPSPDWLRHLLLAVGQRPQGQIVDLSNFVMLDLGQPNHVFDRRRLSDEGIVVRNARSGQTLVTLDGERRELIAADLLICSGEEPVALAGILGGQGSQVEEDTRALLLEVANFAPAVVRRTAMRLGLRTDASARFEKSLDPTLPPVAAGHFARLLQDLQPDVTFPAPPADEGSWSDPSRRVSLRPARVRRILGEEVPDEAIESILGRLGFEVARADRHGALQVAVPSWRASRDVTIEEDLIEEVGRIHRYDRLPERPLVGELVPAPRDPRRSLVRRLQDRLAGAARFHEVLTYSFQSDELLATLGLADEPHVRVVNPVSEGESAVRRSVLPSLLAILTPNRRLRDQVRLFEVGKGYRPEGADGEAGERGEPAEVHQLALVWGAAPPAPGARFDAPSLSRLQGVVEDLLADLGLEPMAWESAVEEPGGSPPPPPWAHPRKALAGRFEGQDGPAALVCELEPGVARALGLEGELASDVAVAEVSIDALLAAPARPAGFRPIPRYPGVKVDVALLAPEPLPAAELAAAIRGAGKGTVVDVELFDLYRGENIGAGKKSLAYHVLLQSDRRTLSDEDGAKFLARLERALERLGAQLRKG